MSNAGLEETQAGIKTAGGNINNLRYAHDTKDPLDENERGEGKVGLKFHIQETRIMASSPITSWQIDGEKMESDRLYFLRL